MKLIVRSFFAVLLVLLAGCTNQKYATVNIHAIGDTELEGLSVAMPINGFSVFQYNDLILTDSVTTLRIPATTVSPISFRYPGGYSAYLVEPGKTYDISLDLSDPNSVKMTIDDPAQQKYSEMMGTMDIYKYEWINDYTQYPLDTAGKKMQANFEELIEKDKAGFDTLQMSRQLADAIYSDIELYWIATLSKVIRNNYLGKNDGAMYDGYAGVWEDIYEKYPVSKKYLHSKWLYPYGRIYVDQFLRNKNNSEAPDSYEGYMQQHYNDLYSNIKDRKALEAVLAQSLYYNFINNNKFQPTILEYVNRFYKDFGTESYSDIFTPYVEKINEFQQAIAKDFPQDVTIVDNYDSIYTLKDAIALFKGKPLFIDFWFSTCVPCREQFKESGALKTFLNENGITMLYISVDLPEADQHWRNIIKYYGLSGNHIRTDHKLHVDMDENYGIMLFPHYMLADADGNIVIQRTANMPDSGEKLIDEIRSALKIQ